MSAKKNSALSLAATSEIATPLSNTGLFPQNRFPVSVDTLTITLRRIATAKGANDAIALVEKTFNEKIEYSLDRPTFMMRQWDGCSIRSVLGCQIHWKAPEDYGNGVLRIHIPGKALAGVPLEDVRSLMAVFAAVYSADCNRIDVAVDDKTGMTKISDLRAAQLDGNYTGYRSHRYITSGKIGEGEGQTVYFGSAKSDSQLRVYDKAVERGVGGSWIRWELQQRRAKANLVFLYWVGLEGLEAADMAAKLGGFIPGAIDFLDRSKRQKDLSRCPRLPWWAALRLRMAEGLSCSVPVPVPTMRSKIGWVCGAVAPSLAAIKKYLGDVDFWQLLEETIEEKGAVMSKLNQAVVDQAKRADMLALRLKEKALEVTGLDKADIIAQLSIAGILPDGGFSYSSG